MSAQYRTFTETGRISTFIAVEQDNANASSVNFQWFMVSTEGVTKVTMKDGTTGVISTVPGVIYSGYFRNIWTTGTTSTIIAMGS